MGKILGARNPALKALEDWSKRKPATQVDQAEVVAPSLLVVFAGNNDFLGVLVDLTTKPPKGITPFDQLRANYVALLNRALKITPDVMLATVPRLTALPLLMQVSNSPLRKPGDPPKHFGYDICLTHCRVSNLTSTIEDTDVPALTKRGRDIAGWSTNFKRYAKAALDRRGGNEAPYPEPSDDGKGGAISPTDVQATTDAIDRFNNFVLEVAQQKDLPVVRFDLLLANIDSGHCRVIDPQFGRALASGWRGGLFSLDGVHLTDVGWRVIGEGFRHALNSEIQRRGSFGGFGLELPEGLHVPDDCLR